MSPQVLKPEARILDATPGDRRGRALYKPRRPPRHQRAPQEARELQGRPAGRAPRRPIARPCTRPRVLFRPAAGGWRVAELRAGWQMTPPDSSSDSDSSSSSEDRKKKKKHKSKKVPPPPYEADTSRPSPRTKRTRLLEVQEGSALWPRQRSSRAAGADVSVRLPPRQRAALC